MTHILESEIKIEDMTMPWRVVLHRCNGSLVTHVETLEVFVPHGDEENAQYRHQCYHHGHYHADDAEGRAAALSDFAIRCKSWEVAPAI